MTKQVFENAIIIKNKTRLEQLTARFNTQAQAKFYITQSQKQFYDKQTSKSQIVQAGKIPDDFANYEQEHSLFYQVLTQVQRTAGLHLKIKVLEREFISSYIFSDKDLIVVVGQDGLVANTAKYVGGRPIVAINPDPEHFDGILLPYTVKTLGPAIEAVLAGTYVRISLWPR